VARALPELSLHQRGVQVLTPEKAKAGGPFRALLDATTLAQGMPPKTPQIA
jgi:hypothetical protein